jgi:hypothetical protein
MFCRSTDVTLSLAPVTYFMVKSIPGIIAGVTLPLSYDICLPPFYLYLFCGDSIPGIIASVTLSLADYICLPSLHLLLILW